MDIPDHVVRRRHAARPISLDASLEHVADGVTGALIHSLAQLPSPGVVSRTSVMQYKETRKPLPEIAEELGVATVLEGSVQRFGSRLKITGQLIVAESDRHLRSDSFEGNMDELLALQDDVARAIAGRMEQTIGRHPGQRGNRVERPVCVTSY